MSDYRWYADHGICPRCRVNPVAPGRRHCEACLAAKREAWRRMKETQPERYAWYRDVQRQYNRTRRGLRAPLTPEEQYARKLANARERYYRRRAEGLCVSCGQPAVPGMAMCQRCREVANARLREHMRKKRREQDGH